MAREKIALEESWLKRLHDCFEQSYMKDLRSFLAEEKRLGKRIVPAGDRIFQAFNITPFERVKVVILGQDPYHGVNQANGLCFSVNTGMKIPPSLSNIFKELQNDLGKPLPESGDLTAWAEQGVLLLNSVLTTELHRPACHARKGWEQFTDTVIEKLNEEHDALVFLLWGAYAQAKGRCIDRQRHLVLETTHPSPFSAHRGFLGCAHFSRTNKYLLQQKNTTIVW